MYPERLFIKDFIYHLPEDRIAKYPLKERDKSKLLVYEDGNIQEDVFFNLQKYIPRSSLLVFNNTRVINARLLFEKSRGSFIELFCLEPSDEYLDVAIAMKQQGKVVWKCLVGNSKKWKVNETLCKKVNINDMKIELHAKKITRLNDFFVIELSWDNQELSFAEVLELAGAVPLPPYINRAAERSDAERYQTVYAKLDGSVAAPTAGLHFTENLLKQLEEHGIERAFVTLHVGAGTFKPVKSATLQEHEMHAEFIEVKKEFITNLLNHLNTKIIAVGTTSLRTIESLYWFGVKTIINPSIVLNDLQLQQWEAYDLNKNEVSSTDALNALLRWMERNNLDLLLTKTQLVIAPGYNFKLTNALITNFHQPQSTLLLLVAAFVHNDWRKIYDYALNNNFRFLSYGDGSLLWRREV